MTKKPYEPSWLVEARRHVGVREIPGTKHNPTILGWAKRLGRKLGIAVADDETPWCGTFVAQCMDAVGLPVAPIAVRAKAWAAYGDSLPLKSTPPLGAIAVFDRQGGGHVGFVVGVTDNALLILGGNQGNRVSVVPIARDRCVALRWPTGQIIASPAPRSATNAPLSKNEA